MNRPPRTLYVIIGVAAAAAIGTAVALAVNPSQPTAGPATTLASSTTSALASSGDKTSVLRSAFDAAGLSIASMSDAKVGSEFAVYCAGLPMDTVNRDKLMASNRASLVAQYMEKIGREKAETLVTAVDRYCGR